MELYIQPSHDPFAFLIVLVKKKDNSWRLCVNYKALNKLTIKIKHHVPLIYELLKELVGATVWWINWYS